MLTPSRLWKKMTLEQRQRAARAFWEDDDAVNDQMQAALLIAQQKKFRPKTIVSLDVDRKARHLAALSPDMIATANPGCTLQIAAAGRRLGHNWPVFHPVELIDASIRGIDPRRPSD